MWEGNTEPKIERQVADEEHRGCLVVARWSLVRGLLHVTLPPPPLLLPEGYSDVSKRRRRIRGKNRTNETRRTWQDFKNSISRFVSTSSRPRIASDVRYPSAQETLSDR